MNTNDLKRNMRLVDTRGRYPVYLEVIRTAVDRSWVDMRCFTWAVAWTSRLRLPKSGVLDLKTYQWGQDDLDSDAKRYTAGGFLAS